MNERPKVKIWVESAGQALKYQGALMDEDDFFLTIFDDKLQCVLKLNKKNVTSVFILK